MKLSVLVSMVKLPVPGSYSAIAPTVSSGWPPERCQRSRSLTTTIGLGEVALDVAEVEGALVGAVRLQGLVHQRGAVGQGALRVGHRGQRLVLHLDELQRVLGQVAAVRDDDRDALADVPHLVRRQAAPGVPGRVGAEVGHRVAQFGGLGAGDHGVHAGQRPAA